MEVPPSPNLSKQRMIFKSRGSRYRAEINEKEEKGDSTPSAKNVQNGSKMENSESPVREHESNGLENGVEENSNNSVDLSVDVEIQNENSGDGDANSVQPEEEDEEHSVSVTFSMPTVTADSTDNKNDEEARKSLDSDPGDYVKVENEDSQLSGAGDSILPADTSILNKEEGEEKKEEEREEEKEDEKPTVVPAEPRGTVVEETKITKEKGGGVGEWMQKNPQMVVHAAVAATVISVAGLGFYIYARKFK